MHPQPTSEHKAQLDEAQAAAREAASREARALQLAAQRQEMDALRIAQEQAAARAERSVLAGVIADAELETGGLRQEAMRFVTERLLAYHTSVVNKAKQLVVQAQRDAFEAVRRLELEKRALQEQLDRLRTGQHQPASVGVAHGAASDAFALGDPGHKRPASPGRQAAATASVPPGGKRRRQTGPAAGGELIASALVGGGITCPGDGGGGSSSLRCADDADEDGEPALMRPPESPPFARCERINLILAGAPDWLAERPDEPPPLVGRRSGDAELELDVAGPPSTLASVREILRQTQQKIELSGTQRHEILLYAREPAGGGVDAPPAITPASVLTDVLAGFAKFLPVLSQVVVQMVERKGERPVYDVKQQGVDHGGPFAEMITIFAKGLTAPRLRGLGPLAGVLAPLLQVQVHAAGDCAHGSGAARGDASSASAEPGLQLLVQTDRELIRAGCFDGDKRELFVAGGVIAHALVSGVPLGIPISPLCLLGCLCQLTVGGAAFRSRATITTPQAIALMIEAELSADLAKSGSATAGPLRIVRWWDAQLADRWQQLLALAEAEVEAAQPSEGDPRAPLPADAWRLESCKLYIHDFTTKERGCLLVEPGTQQLYEARRVLVNHRIRTLEALQHAIGLGARARCCGLLCERSRSLAEFGRGFREPLDTVSGRLLRPALRRLPPDEFAELVCGRPTFTGGDLWEESEAKDAQKGDPLSEQMERQGWLEKIVRGLSEENLRLLLQFGTGLNTLPPGGLGNMKLTFIFGKIESGYPTASTCTRTISLRAWPCYNSSEALSENLLAAITNTDMANFHRA